MLNIRSKRKIVAVLSFVLGALLLITTAFAKNTSASAESSLSVEETAAKVYAVGVCPVYDYILAESNENYVCTLHFVFNIDTYYYNPDYEYGFFNATYHDFLSVKETGTVSNNYVEKFEELDLPYNFLDSGGFDVLETIHHQTFLNMNIYSSQSLDVEYICMMYVKDTATGEIVYAEDEAIIASYNSVLNNTDSDLDYYKGLYAELSSENAQLKAELDELKGDGVNVVSDKNWKIILGVVGGVVLLALVVGLITEFSRKDKKQGGKRK